MASTLQDELEELHISNLRPRFIKSSLFSAIILACWDNVMGPMVTKVWRGNEKVEVNDQIINYISNHTLSGELCRQMEKNTIDPKFCILPDMGYIFAAVIFNGHSKNGATITSLSFVMSYSDLQRYLLLQEFMLKQLKFIILKYRMLQQKDLDTAVKYFSSFLKLFVKTIDSIEQRCVSPNICIFKTIFDEGEEANNYQLLDLRFLMRCVTSHLQTCGTTVVAGKSAEKINLVKTFVTLHRRTILHKTLMSKIRERHICDDPQESDMFQDAEVKVQSSQTKLSASNKNILLNSFPVTWIDVDEKTIQQTSPLNKHEVIRKNFIMLELSLLLHGTQALDYPAKKVLHKALTSKIRTLFTDEIGGVSEMVQKHLTDLFSLPVKCSVRKAHIKNFMILLQHKASSFIAYVEETGTMALTSQQIYKLKQDLSLTSAPDFSIVLAMAEKKIPGFASYFFGEMFKRDAQMQAVLEDF